MLFSHFSSPSLAFAPQFSRPLPIVPAQAALFQDGNMEQPSNYSLSKDEYFLLSCRNFYGSQVLYVNKWVGRRNVRARTRIWLDRIACGGREYNLGYCLRKRNRWGQVRCSRQRLAGVMCDPGLENLIKTPPLDNATKHIDVSDSSVRKALSQRNKTFDVSSNIFIVLSNRSYTNRLIV